VNSQGAIIRPHRSLENLKVNNHKGKISHKSNKKIKTAIDYLLLLTKNKKITHKYKGTDYQFKLSFITLTLSSVQVHSDNIIKKELLHQFLLEIQTKFKVKNYIWRAETQANGNIHFHIIADKFIPHSDIRNIWNRIQQKLGYVTRYRDNMKNVSYQQYKEMRLRFKTVKEETIKKAYREGKIKDWNNPNSTDVHMIKLINDLARYMAKYQTKNEENRRPVTGRLWGCNELLSECQGVTVDLNNDYSEDLFQLKQLNKESFYYHKYFTYIGIRFIEYKHLSNNMLMILFYCHLKEVYQKINTC
jgi:hypothetical protein